jgi:hypothetical protein
MVDAWQRVAERCNVFVSGWTANAFARPSNSKCRSAIVGANLRYRIFRNGEINPIRALDFSDIRVV